MQTLGVLLSPTFEPFNTREVAVSIWTIGFISWQMRSNEVRESISNVVKCILKWKLLTIYFVSSVWTLIITLLLQQIGFWNITLLKDTLIWTFASGVFLSLKSVSEKNIAEYFKTVAKDTISFLVCFQFIVNAYTFNFWIELFVVFPLLATLAISKVLIDHNKDYMRLKKPLGCIQITIGWIIIIAVFALFFQEPGKLASKDSFKQFSLPVILTIANLPLIYLIGLISGYEQLYVRLKIGKQRPFAVRLYGLLKFIDHFRLDYNEVTQSLKRLAVPILQASSHDEIDAMIKKDLAYIRGIHEDTDNGDNESSKIRLPILEAFRDPKRLVSEVIDFGLTNSDNDLPVWRFNGDYWYSLAQIITHHGAYLRVGDVDNRITCMHSSESKNQVQMVRWTADVFNADGKEPTESSFRQFCSKYLELLDLPSSEVTKALMSNEEKIFETSCATISFKYLTYEFGYGRQLQINTKFDGES
jgi:hypothetical protein